MLVASLPHVPHSASPPCREAIGPFPGQLPGLRGQDGPWAGRGRSLISELGGFRIPGPQPQCQRHRPLEPAPRQAPQSSRPGSMMAPGVCASKTLSFLSPGSCCIPSVPRLTSTCPQGRGLWWPQSCGACQGPAGASQTDFLSCPTSELLVALVIWDVCHPTTSPDSFSFQNWPESRLARRVCSCPSCL